MKLNKIKCVVLDFDGTLYSNGDWSNEPKLLESIWFQRIICQNARLVMIK